MVDSVRLDAYDRQILYALDCDARQTTAEIGRRIRKSKQFVDYRIKRLEELGVLQGYIAVIDYARLGYQSVRVYFKFRKLTPEQQAELEKDLYQDDEVWWLVTLEGVWDVGYAMAVQNLLDFYSYWDRIMTKYRQYISRKSVVIYTHIRQYPKSYLTQEMNTAPGTIVGATTERAAVDELDMRLLQLLASDGRAPLLDLARHCDTSPQVVKHRMKKLEAIGVLQGYRALIDVSFLGYRYYKSYINLLSTDKLKALDQFCLQHPNILNVNRTIGGRDYEIELQAKDFDEFDSIMKQLRTEFAGMIDDYEFVIAREEKKMVYFPFG